MSKYHITADAVSVAVCQAQIDSGRGCPDPIRPQGTCSGCRDVVKAVKDKLRPKFEPATMEDVSHIAAAAAGVECFVCRREPQPGLTYKHLAVCVQCAPLGLARESMITLNDTTDAEDAAGMAGIDRAGEYLASIGKFDLRELTEWELKQFNAHWLNGFSADMRERVSMQPPF